MDDRWKAERKRVLKALERLEDTAVDAEQADGGRTLLSEGIRIAVREVKRAIYNIT